MKLVLALDHLCNWWACRRNLRQCQECKKLVRVTAEAGAQFCIPCFLKRTRPRAVALARMRVIPGGLH